jgi:hypothetical protein
MKPTTLIFFSVLSVLTACNGQSANAKKQHAVHIDETIVAGDTVAELGSNIMVVYQDKRMNYWFGSWQTGVYKYDGKTLIQYTTKHGLFTDRVDDIEEDNAGNIYFSGMNPNGTITKYDGKSFTHIVATPSNDWKLEPNDVWLLNPYQEHHKVFRVEGNTVYELTLPSPPGFDNSFDVYSIYRNRKGNIWFGTNPLGVCRYDGKSFDWILERDVVEIYNAPTEGSNGVRSITEDKQGDFWFNTEYRYSVYDSATLSSNAFYTRHKSIGSLDGKNTPGLNEYLSTVRDNENNLWFVTYRDGVWKYDGVKVTHYNVQENGKDITLFSIYKDNIGDLWLGTHEHGAYKFNGKTFEKFKP